MTIKNKILINAISRTRNEISADKDAMRFNNIHSANNEITIIGKNSSLSFEGKDSYIRSSKVQIKGKDNAVTVGKNSVLSDSCSIRITGNNNIVSIGDNCRISNTSIYIIGSNNHIEIENDISSVLSSFHLEDNGNKAIVKKGSTLHGREYNLIEFALDEGTEIQIGEDCMISNDVSFRSSDSHSVLDNSGERINPAGNILIKNHVWIGMKTIILKNTVIHDDCGVGAGSICNRDYKKDNCLIAGNPAKVVKESVNWSRDRL